MRLYLCGGGSGKQIKNALLHFSRIIDKTKPILYIPLAMESEKYDDCYNWFKNEIKNMKVSNFEMVKSSSELSNCVLSNYSALFIGGGNTYKLLSEIKKFSNYEKIMNYLNNGGIIFGGSAGAIIFGKSIDTCLLDDGNIVGLKDKKGFNMLNDYSILCHLNKNNFKKNCSYLKENLKKEKIIYLPEEDIVLINDNKVSIIGKKKYVIFKNGEYVYHNFANFKKDIMNE